MYKYITRYKICSPVFYQVHCTLNMYKLLNYNEHSNAGNVMESQIAYKNLNLRDLIIIDVALFGGDRGACLV